MIFLNEGTKILFRVCYSVMKRLHKIILDTQKPEEMMNECKKGVPNIMTDSNYIIFWAFRMRLSRRNNRYIKQKEKKTNTTRPKVYIYIYIYPNSNIGCFDDQTKGGYSIYIH